VTFDGNGHVINYTGVFFSVYGVRLHGSTNSTVKNVVIEGFVAGNLDLPNANNNRIYNNILNLRNGGKGIVLSNAQNNPTLS
jgi:hypothetical protein